MSSAVTTVDDEAERRSPSQAVRSGLWLAAFVGPAAVWFGASWVLAATAPSTYAEGECVAFGCGSTPADGVWFSAFLLGLVAVPVATVASLMVTAAVLAPKGRRWRAAGQALLWAAVAVVVAATVAQASRWF